MAWRGVGDVERLEESVRYRRLTIGDVPLGLVDDGGQFIVVTLDNVPHYVPDEQVLAHNTVIPLSVNQVHTRFTRLSAAIGVQTMRNHRRS